MGGIQHEKALMSGCDGRMDSKNGAAGDRERAYTARYRTLDGCGDGHMGHVG